jgi:type II secretory pathway component GspD/PulD (secretin)
MLPVRHRDAAEVAKLLPPSYSGAYTVDEARNALVAFSDPETVRSLEREVNALDRPVQRVMVDVLVTEMTKEGSKELGLDWEYSHGRFGGLLPLGPGSTAGQIFYQGVGQLNREFFSKLSLLETQGKANVRANPRLLATSGTESTINIRRTNNFFFASGVDSAGNPVLSRSDISADTVVKIKPVVLDGGRISLTIDATVDSFIFKSNSDLPDTTRRQAITKLFCADGESVVIGGLTLEEDTWNQSKTPVLGDLPILGGLFRHTNRLRKHSDMAIFITPRVVGMDGKVEAAGLAPQ